MSKGYDPPFEEIMFPEQSPRYRPQRRLGCLAVPVVALGIVACLFPAVEAAREAARRSQCVCNMCGIKLALHNYHSVWNCFPPAVTTDAHGRPMHSWRVLILSQMEQAPLYNQYNLNEPWDGPNNIKLLNQMPRCFACPSRNPDSKPPTTLTSYVAPTGPGTIFPGPNASTKIADINDGTSKTLMIVEVSNVNIPWMAPYDFDVRLMSDRVNDRGRPGISSKHTGGANVTFADASTKFMTTRITPRSLRALLTIAGGEEIDVEKALSGE